MHINTISYVYVKITIKIVPFDDKMCFFNM